MPSPRVLPFHVDLHFQGDRSMWLEEAAFRLETDTRGKLRIEYRYDLDINTRYPRDEWYLIELPEASEVTSHFDKKHGTRVVGECDSDNRIVYLISERLTTHDRFVHVAMHEILHAVGLKHVVGDPQAIMAAIVVPRLPLHMSSTDLDAFCSVLQCPMRDVR